MASYHSENVMLTDESNIKNWPKLAAQAAKLAYPVRNTLSRTTCAWVPGLRLRAMAAGAGNIGKSRRLFLVVHKTW